MSVPTTTPLIWFITGTSSGFGESLALAATARGDKVIATARTISAIESLKAKAPKGSIEILQLDVTATTEEIMKIVEAAVGIWGRVDVLVNNAGYGYMSTIEESEHEETVKQFNTNVFGTLNVTKSFLPVLRSQGSGKIVNISSMVGQISIPISGIYAATKHALEAITDALAAEVAAFGIQVVSIEPSLHSTPGAKGASSGFTGPLTIYDPLRAAIEGMFSGIVMDDANKAMERVVDIVRGEGYAKGKPWPLRVAIGAGTIPMLTQKAENALKELKEWEELTISTTFDKKAE